MRTKIIMALVTLVTIINLTNHETAQLNKRVFAQTSQVTQVVSTVEFYDKTDPRQALNHWAIYYKTDAQILLNVCKAESGCRNGEVDPIPVCSFKYGCEHATGPMQFLPSTFYANAPRAGIIYPNILSIDDQARTAAYMFHIGQQNQWETYDRIYKAR